MSIWILAILRAHFAHLVEEFLLAVEVRLWVLQAWRLVRAASAGHGHHHVRILRQLGALAARGRASKIRLAHSRLHVPELRHAARPTVGCLQWPTLVGGVHHLDVACRIEPLGIRPGLLGVLLVSRMASSASCVVIHHLIVCPSLRVQLPHRRVRLPVAARRRRRAANIEEDATRDRQGIAGIVRVHFGRAAAEVRLVR